MIRVYLLDDHEVVRRGLAALLESSGDIEVIGESGSAPEAARRIPALRPDVAVLDARLPDGNGIDVCRDVRSADPSIKALILTSYQDDEALFSAIMAGAAGYVLKQIRGTDLIDAIRRVAAGRRHVDPALGAQLAVPDDVPELQPVSDRERDVLHLLALGYTNQQIAAKLFISARTVDTHRAHIMQKLRLNSRAELVLFALSTGLIGPA